MALSVSSRASQSLPLSRAAVLASSVRHPTLNIEDTCDMCMSLIFPQMPSVDTGFKIRSLSGLKRASSPQWYLAAQPFPGPSASRNPCRWALVCLLFSDCSHSGLHMSIARGHNSSWNLEVATNVKGSMIEHWGIHVVKDGLRGVCGLYGACWKHTQHVRKKK